MQDRTKILYLITGTNVGGTEKALLELLRRINRDQYAVYVCSMKKPGGFSERIAAAADGFYSLGLSEAGGLRAVLSFLPAFLRLLRLLRKLSPLMIHSFLFRANILGRIAGRAAGVPIIISSIRVIERDKRYKHIIDRLTSSAVDQYIAVSEAAREFTIKQINIPPEKIVTVYNGIDCERLPDKGPNDFIIDGCSNNIALIGRFERQKGHPVLIQALKTVLRQTADIKVYFLGEGPDEARIKDMVADAGLSEQVVFVGVVADVGHYISQMDIIVLPSLWEGLPNVLLEAMAAGCPVIASRVEGVDEVVVDGGTGILPPPGDPDQLAKALLKLIQNRRLAEQMGKAGKVRVLEKFSITETVRETQKIYRNLLTDYDNSGRDV